ncbi:MAG: hypothetical protein ACPGYX_07960, partial [Oceanobacter sp.]
MSLFSKIDVSSFQLSTRFEDAAHLKEVGVLLSADEQGFFSICSYSDGEQDLQKHEQSNGEETFLVAESTDIESRLSGLIQHKIELGRVNANRGCFLYVVEKRSDVDRLLGASSQMPLVWQSPRTILSGCNSATFELVSRALQLANWVGDHRYCGCCGTELRLKTDMKAMHCEPCQREYFPRLSPCIITLVTRGDECLLACHVSRPQFFTTLAGFIEAGESAENCVHR